MSSTIMHTFIGAVRTGNKGDKILRISPDDLFNMADRETTVFIGESRLRGWVVPPPLLLANNQLASPHGSDSTSQQAHQQPNRSSSRREELGATQSPPQMYRLNFCADQKLVEGNCGKIIYVMHKGSKKYYRVGMLVSRLKAYPNIYQAVVLCHNIASLVWRYKKISSFNLIDEGDAALEATCCVDDLVSRQCVEEVEARHRSIECRESEEGSRILSAAVPPSSYTYRSIISVCSRR